MLTCNSNFESFLIRCFYTDSYFVFSSVQSLSRVRLCDPMIADQASLPITSSQSPPKPMSIESVMPSNHLILCHPLHLLPSTYPSIRVFSSESVPHIRWSKYWSFSISPSNEYLGLISLGLTGLISLQSKGLSRVFSTTTVLKHQWIAASKVHQWFQKCHLGSHIYIHIYLQTSEAKQAPSIYPRKRIPWRSSA